MSTHNMFWLRNKKKKSVKYSYLGTCLSRYLHYVSGTNELNLYPYFKLLPEEVYIDILMKVSYIEKTLAESLCYVLE